MTDEKTSRELIWISTDWDGQIQHVSRTACRLLGASTRQSLFRYFPRHLKQMTTDMDSALSGFPRRRTALLEPVARQPLAVEYTVSSRFTPDSVTVYWFFDFSTVNMSGAH